MHDYHRSRVNRAIYHPLEIQQRHFFCRLRRPCRVAYHLIGKLYAAEERARHAPARCQRLRERYSRMVLGKIKALLNEHLETTLPGGKLGQALGYLGNQWPGRRRA
ncbi:MAG: transposase [Burkholderia sp.]